MVLFNLDLFEVIVFLIVFSFLCNLFCCELSWFFFVDRFVMIFVFFFKVLCVDNNCCLIFCKWEVIFFILILVVVVWCFNKVVVYFVLLIWLWILFKFFLKDLFLVLVKFKCVFSFLNFCCNFLVMIFGCNCVKIEVWDELGEKLML